MMIVTYNIRNNNKQIHEKISQRNSFHNIYMYDILSKHVISVAQYHNMNGKRVFFDPNNLCRAKYDITK